MERGQRVQVGFTSKQLMSSRNQRGMSLLELMITVSIAMILMGTTYIYLGPALNRGHIDSAYETTLMTLRDTRHLAITQSHEYQVIFNSANSTIQVEYQPAPVGGIAQPLQLVNTYQLPTDIKFGVQAGFPASAPDGFGSGVTAVDFGQGLGGGSLNYVTFMPDGSSRDGQDIYTGGNYNSGVVYITRQDGNKYDSRAITVWGTTGRIRGWKLYPKSGSPTWVQQ